MKNLLSMFSLKGGSLTAKLSALGSLLALVLPLFSQVQVFLQSLPGDKGVQYGAWAAFAVAVTGRAIGWIRAINAAVGDEAPKA